MRRIRIGSGAGFADDRVDSALDLVERGEINYLGFECLAERTIALAHRELMHNPDRGYNEWLDERISTVLPGCAERGIKIISNMGAANPLGAARRVAELAKELGVTGIRIAAVTGDDVLATVREQDLPFSDRDGSIATLRETIISANAYLGTEGIVEALAGGADVIITGRVADPALFLAPILYEFGWSEDDHDRIGMGVALGHLLECAAQVSGGYFADPGFKDVPDLVNVGFPIADVAEDGSFFLTKAPGTGGAITAATCTEQLLYEVHDPSRYFTPDAIADFSGITFAEHGPDHVDVSGATSIGRPETLKVSVGYLDGFIGIGEISYAGPNALARGELARSILAERLKKVAPSASDSSIDLIGVDAVARLPKAEPVDPPEVRVRMAARTQTMSEAAAVGREVVSLWLCGPTGGAGATRRSYENLGIASILLPREQVQASVTYMEV